MGAELRERKMPEHADHWRFFNYANILSEGKARLAEARSHPTKLTPEKDTLEYWCAWAAHANAASCLTTESNRDATDWRPQS